MEKKWCLLKVSDGSRGNNGKKKIYEITVSGNSVVMSWGMAEKSQRQTTVVNATSDKAAMFIATQKMWDKVTSGYEIAYTV